MIQNYLYKFTDMLFRIILLTTFSLIISNCDIDSSAYIDKINKTLLDLSVNDYIKSEVYFESCNLIDIGKGLNNKKIFLDSVAAIAFLKMQEDAKKDSIEFIIVSAFRSFDYQKGIIIRKLNMGRKLKDILKENTLPGYSEHHTGRAVDFIEKGWYSLSTSFDKTKEFQWLMENANKYGFYLSYPEGNKNGIMYEPWHWMYRND